jgi:hypothetical protein
MLGRERKLSRYRWWSEHFERIQAALYSRYLLVLMGEEPDPPERFLRYIWSDDPRPMWATHKEAAGARSRESVLKIIAAVENRARKDRDEADSRSKEDR